MFKAFRLAVKEILPDEAVFFYGNVRTGEWAEDADAVRAFLRDPRIPLTLKQRMTLLRRYYRVSIDVNCPHTQAEVLAYATAILTVPDSVPGVFVEAGCFKGGSTAKFSLAARAAGRELVVFDSFQGIPENEEPHETNIFGGPAAFHEGDYCGSFEEVTGHVATYGYADVCSYQRGWFEDTMPGFDRPIAGAYLDCDLASSTRTCLKYLYPLLQPGGVLFSQDAHLPLVIDVLTDRTFWEEELGIAPPLFEGLGTSKLVKCTKPFPAPSVARA